MCCRFGVDFLNVIFFGNYYFFVFAFAFAAFAVAFAFAITFAFIAFAFALFSCLWVALLLLFQHLFRSSCCLVACYEFLAVFAACVVIFFPNFFVSSIKP